MDKENCKDIPYLCHFWILGVIGLNKAAERYINEVRDGE